MLGTPYHYRDGRTDDAIEQVHARVPPPELYARNGLQFLPFNTIYQLTADDEVTALGRRDAARARPDHVLADRQSRVRAHQRLDHGAARRQHPRLGHRPRDPARHPDRHPRRPGRAGNGGRRAPRRPRRLRSGCAGGPTVTVVGSHDTASAVVGTPMTTDDAAYISCGTWGLVGLELERPILSEASRAAGFTNEGGVDGRIRFLHNVMGLWLLSESVRQWERGGESHDVEQLVRAGGRRGGVRAGLRRRRPTVPRTGGHAGADRTTGARSTSMMGPAGVVETVRSILESLAEAFAASIDRAAELSGRTVGVVHLVGGGARNALLCQLTADRCGRPVLAGPVEATATGNLLVQARALGLVGGDLEALRAITAAGHPPTRYDPDTDAGVAYVMRALSRATEARGEPDRHQGRGPQGGRVPGDGVERAEPAGDGRGADPGAGAGGDRRARLRPQRERPAAARRVEPQHRAGRARRREPVLHRHRAGRRASGRRRQPDRVAVQQLGQHRPGEPAAGAAARAAGERGAAVPDLRAADGRGPAGRARRPRRAARPRRGR